MQCIAFLEKTTIMRSFHIIADFLNVIWEIDCAHVAIKYPSFEELKYVGRKRYLFHVQVICDAQANFWNTVAKCPQCKKKITTVKYYLT